MENAEDKALSTNIGKTTNTAMGMENSVSTIEHLMAAFVGLDDNALVKIDGLSTYFRW